MDFFPCTCAFQTISETSFVGQRKLQELHMEDNRLKVLSHFNLLFNIKRLYLGMNKIQVIYMVYETEDTVVFQNIKFL